MKPFITRPTTVHLERDWMLTLSPMKVEVFGHVYEVPAGMVTDGASIPPWLQWLVSRGDIWMSAIAHDFFRGVFRNQSNFSIDGVFFDLCLAETHNRRKSILAYIGVRIGTYIGFTSEPPPTVIEAALAECSERGIPLSRPQGPTKTIKTENQ